MFEAVGSTQSYSHSVGITTDSPATETSSSHGHNASLSDDERGHNASSTNQPHTGKQQEGRVLATVTTIMFMFLFLYKND